MAKYWDGKESLPYKRNDGGRAAAGFRGLAGDCVARSIAIASGLPYAEVYAALAAGNATQFTAKGTKRAASARNGVNTRRQWFKDYMQGLGFTWTPTMQIGSGCKVHLLRGELPMGRLVVAVSKHYTAVIDGVINDMHDPTRTPAVVTDASGTRLAHRCVYGYWSKA